MPSMAKFVLATLIYFSFTHLLVLYTDQLLTAKILWHPDNLEVVSTISEEIQGKQLPEV